MKIVYQGIAGSYSESCAKYLYPNIETIPCKTFDECFLKASKDDNSKICLLYTSPSPRDPKTSRMPSSA